MKEIKEEEFDAFLQEYPSTFQTVEEKPGLEYECKTEMYTSSIMALKEENNSPMEIKDETDSKEYGDFDSSPTSKLLAYCRGWFVFTVPSSVCLL